MKIEKISENQIKCTLTRSDLASRQLRLSEIAYGTEKANGLFRDMMDQANLEFGFDTADLPIMIEAIPVSMDCIILMITKVEDPEEVDTRYPGLTALNELLGEGDTLSGSNEFTDDIFLNLENFLKEPVLAPAAHAVHSTLQKSGTACLLSFDTLEHAILYAHQITDCSLTESSLYKSASDSAGHSNLYYLVLHFSADSSSDYAYASTVALEFGRCETCTSSRLAYIHEHLEPILTGDAVTQLAAL